MLDPEHIFPNPSSLFAQSSPGGSPEFSTPLQATQEYGLSSPPPAAHPRRCSSSSHLLLPGLLVTFPQEPLQGETLSGNWDHKTLFFLLVTASSEPVFMGPENTGVPHSPSKRWWQDPFADQSECCPSALPGLHHEVSVFDAEPAVSLPLASTCWKHFF